MTGVDINPIGVDFNPNLGARNGTAPQILCFDEGTEIITFRASLIVECQTVTIDGEDPPIVTGIVNVNLINYPIIVCFANFNLKTDFWPDIVKNIESLKLYLEI